MNKLSIYWSLRFPNTTYRCHFVLFILPSACFYQQIAEFFCETKISAWAFASFAVINKCSLANVHDLYHHFSHRVASVRYKDTDIRNYAFRFQPKDCRLLQLYISFTYHIPVNESMPSLLFSSKLSWLLLCNIFAINSSPTAPYKGHACRSLSVIDLLNSLVYSVFLSHCLCVSFFWAPAATDDTSYPEDHSVPPFPAKRHNFQATGSYKAYLLTYLRDTYISPSTHYEMRSCRTWQEDNFTEAFGIGLGLG